MLVYACILMNRYVWNIDYVCLTVDLTMFLLIIPSFSLHLFIMFCDCCVSMDPLLFIGLHLVVMQMSSFFF